MRTRVLTLLAAATVAVAAPSVASAATTIKGTLPVALANVTSSTAVIGSGTTFSYGGGFVFGLGTTDFGGVSFLTPVNVSAVTATVGSAVNFTSAFGSFTGTVKTVGASNASLSSVVSLYALGAFTPTGSLSAFATGPASLTFSFNQTGGANAAVQGGFTLASPPAGVPEPATWGMMIAGAAMAGAAVRRRRSSAKVVAA